MIIARMKKHIFIFLAALILLSGCKFKVTDRPNWDTEVVTPLVYSNVTLDDLVTDSSVVHVNPDQSIDIVYRDTVMNFALADYVEVPDTQVAVTVNLETLTLTSGSICERQWVDDIMRQLGIPQNLIDLAQILTYFPVAVAPQDTLSSGTVPIDASDYFEEADLIDGWMTIAVENTLPTRIDSVVFELKLASDNSVVISDTLFDITPNSTKTSRTWLGGKHVESSMIGELVKAKTDSIPQGPSSPFDTTTQYIEVCVILDSLTAERAEAVFPEQRVIDNFANVKYYFGEDVKITKMGIRSGTLLVNAVSTIDNPLNFTYSLPSTTKDGIPVSVTANLPAAPPNGTSVVDTMFDLGGHFTDLTVNGDSTNLFPQHIIGNLVYTGDLVFIDLSDSIRVEYGLVDIIPEYIEGYIGSQSFTVTDTLAFELMNRVLSGTASLEDADIGFTFLNSIGVDGELNVNRLTSVNNRSNTRVDLDAAPFNNPLTISGARLPNIGQVSSTFIPISIQNSNIQDFISNLPDQVEYDLEVLANKNAIPSLLNNFATYESEILALLDLTLPLYGFTDKLTLQDTSDLDFASVELPDPLDEATFELIIENTFPFQTDVQLYFVDDLQVTIDSAFSQGMVSVPAGTVDQNGIVQEPGKVTLKANFDHERLYSIINDAKQTLTRFAITTKPNNTNIRIYSNYGINFKLVGDFKVKVGG